MKIVDVRYNFQALPEILNFRKIYNPNAGY